MSFGDLRYIADSINEYAGEVRAMLELKREGVHRGTGRLVEADKARTAATEAELAALCPAQVKLANLGKPKHQDPQKPECTWAGTGKQPGWLKESWAASRQP